MTTGQSDTSRRCEDLFSTLVAVSSNTDNKPKPEDLIDAETLGRVDPAAVKAIELSLAAMHAPSMSAAADAAMTDNPDCYIETHWWGIDMIFSESLTNKISIGTVATGGLTTIIGGALAGLGVLAGAVVGPLAGGFAAALGLKSAEIKLVDSGNGVHFPISWPQMGLVVAGVSAGPAGIIAAIMAFIHPVAR